MYTRLLQDWTSISGALGDNDFTQSESDWVSFEPYQDVVLYTEVSAFNLGGAPNLQVIYETSPARDEPLFVPMTTVAVTGDLQVDAVILATGPAVPLARWLRWRLHVVDIDHIATAGWLATFRLHCATNAVGRL